MLIKNNANEIIFLYFLGVLQRRINKGHYGLVKIITEFISISLL